LREPDAELPPSDTANGPALLCLRCRYNLHGLTEDGLCPECALPIRASREGRPLYHYPRRWLEHAAQAVTLLAVATWATSGLKLSLLLNLIPSRSSVPAGEFPTARAAAIVINVLISIAYWLIAAPQQQVHEPAFSRRRMVRIAAVFKLAIELLIYTGLVKTRIERASYFVAFYVIDITAAAFLTLYLRRLAALLGRPGLGLQLSVAFIGWAASLAATHATFWTFDLLRLTLWRHLHLLPSLPLAEAAWWPFTLYFGLVLFQFRFAFLDAACNRE
jgi:hypothetical protein